MQGTTAGTNFFADWKQTYADKSEWFCFGLNEWSIDKAKMKLKTKPRRTWPLNVKDWKGIAQIMNEPKPLGKKIDMSVPVICIPFGTGWLPIDGWSRIRLAISRGVETIQCVRLSKTEAISLERENVDVIVPNSTKPVTKTKPGKQETNHVHLQEAPEADRRKGAARTREGSAAVRGR